MESTLTLSLRSKTYTNPQSIPCKEISEFLNNHPEKNFFQSIEILDFFEHVQDHLPVCILVWEQTKIVGLLVGLKIENNGVRYYFDNGPLIIRNRSNVCQKILFALEKLSGDSVSIQFRWQLYPVKREDVFESFAYTKQERYNILIDLQNDDIFNEFCASKRRQLRQSYENGLRISPVGSLDELLVFYSILEDLYLKKVQKPLPSFNFFSTFYQLMQKQNQGIILVAHYRGRIVGGIVCPFSDNETIHEWYIAGQDKDYYRENVYPSVYLTYAAIKYGKDSGFTQFDFMGAGIPAVPYGVRDFKLRFGGELKKTFRYLKQT